jgi:hypothetical protein
MKKEKIMGLISVGLGVGMLIGVLGAIGGFISVTAFISYMVLAVTLIYILHIEHERGIPVRVRPYRIKQ